MNRHKKLVFAKTAIVLTCLAIAAKSSAQIGPSERPPLVISEFREHGPYGAMDEYVEIYNNSNTPHRVGAAINSAGYAIVASDGYARCVIPTGTVITARGHFLCVNRNGYSLSSYPAGPGTATGDASFTKDIPDNSGLALFSTSNKYDFNLTTRIDAIGPSEVDALFREGIGFQNSFDGGNGAYYRDNCGKRGDTDNFAPCQNAGLPIDTDDNSHDFLYVFPNHDQSDFLGRQTMGAPGPENLASPIYLGAGFELKRTLLDPLVGLSTSPNRVRDPTPSNGLDLSAHFGTLTFRRTFTNKTNSPITALRLRIIDATPYFTDSANGNGDIRALSSANTHVFTSGGLRLVRGTTLEEPPYQSKGGGFNSSLSANGISSWSPLMPGASVDLQLMFGVGSAEGRFHFEVVIETLPGTASDVWYLYGNTEYQIDSEWWHP